MCLFPPPLFLFCFFHSTANTKKSPFVQNDVMKNLFRRYAAQTGSIGDVLKEIEREEREESRGGVEDALLDHVAFRTFKGVHEDVRFVNVKRFLVKELQYRESGETLVFPKKKVKATWLKPPVPLMPRAFVSEIDVEAFEDERMTAIVRKAIDSRREEPRGAALEDLFREQKRGAFSLCKNVTKEEYEYVAKKSEYVAWLLINGPEFVNHFALAMHRCRSEAFSCASGEEMSTKVVEKISKIARLNGAEDNRVMNVSDDKKLWQFSTVSDDFLEVNALGEKLKGCGAYIEFAYREFMLDGRNKENAGNCSSSGSGSENNAEKRIKKLEEEEALRRDGFEVANADAIFESTKI